MSKIVWDATGEHFYETGVDRGVLFPMGSDGAYEKGVGWNGLTNVAENPDGAENTDIYADNVKYLSLRSAENFGFTINCYQFPKEFLGCDGALKVGGVILTQQRRKAFGFAYRTLIGNDVDGQDHGYKLHLCYNATASPSSKDNNTVNDTPEADELSYECTTVPVPVTGYKPTAHIIIDSRDYTTEAAQAKLTALEDMLYGTENSDPTLPTPDDLIDMMSFNPSLTVAPEDSEAELFGISVSDMQTGITVGNNAISGTLKFINGGWDAGTWSAEESTGNYLALKVDSDEGAVVTVELVNGVHGPVTLDEDMNIVLRVTNSETQSVRVKTTVAGKTVTKTYSLTGLVLNAS